MFLTLQIVFVQKLLSAYYVCCIHSNALQTNFTTESEHYEPCSQSDLGPYYLQ